MYVRACSQKCGCAFFVCTKLNQLNFKIMIYFKSFYDYKKFNEVFGLRECGNGSVSRKNKILLGCLKDKNFFKFCLSHKEYNSILFVNNMADFKRVLLYGVANSSISAYFKNSGYRKWKFAIDGNNYIFYVTNMEMDGNGGICDDGDAGAIRYRNVETDRIYKMKAGKFFNKILDGCEFGRVLPQQAKCWLGEEFTTAWQSFAESKTSNDYKFHYGDNRSDFEEIYSSENRRGDFHSCMTDEDNSSMYKYAVKAHAAWLTDSEGLMFARCVVWDEVHDETTGETLRLAERQYSDGVNDAYKKMLVNELIKRNLIDGYKQIGASCHDNQAYVLNDGTSISDHKLWIDCELNDEDTVSYMDSFVYYDENKNRAYNYYAIGSEECLNTTDGVYNGHSGQVYSEYYEEWIDEEDAYYVESRGDYYRYKDVVFCEQCDTCVLKEEAIYNADVEEWFCDEDCERDWMERHDYVWDENNECYIPEDEAITFYEWEAWKGDFCGGPTTTSRDDLVDDYLYDVDGEYYYTDGDDDAEKKIHSMVGEIWSVTDDDWIDKEIALTVMATGDCDGWFEDYIDPKYHPNEIAENGGVKYLLDCDNAEELFKKMTLPACVVA